MNKSVLRLGSVYEPLENFFKQNFSVFLGQGLLKAIYYESPLRCRRVPKLKNRVELTGRKARFDDRDASAIFSNVRNFLGNFRYGGATAERVPRP